MNDASLRYCIGHFVGVVVGSSITAGLITHGVSAPLAIAISILSTVAGLLTSPILFREVRR